MHHTPRYMMTILEILFYEYLSCRASLICLRYSFMKYANMHSVNNKACIVREHKYA